MIGAEVIQFPGTAICKAEIVPVVTIARYASLPKQLPWRAAGFPQNVSGFAVEALNFPGGGIGVLGFHRDEATAWERATTLAKENGWLVERNRRLAVAVARRMVAEARQ